MEERNAKVYSDEQLASELKTNVQQADGAKALSIAGVILVVAGLMTTLISVAIFGVILCLIGALVMNSHEKSMKQQIGDHWCEGYWKACLKRWIISDGTYFRKCHGCGSAAGRISHRGRQS